METLSFTRVTWTPTFIGIAISLPLYGASIGQYLFYIRFFSNDHYILKSAAFIVFMFDTVHTAITGRFYWRMLVLCRWNTSYECTLALPWELSVTMIITCLIAFCVQCFYAHRVWIMSARNKPLICLVLSFACTQLVFGMLFAASAYTTREVAALFDNWFCSVTSLSNAICDVIIMISTFIYLRPLRNSPIRKVHYIRQFNFIFMQMGLITSITSLMLAIFYTQFHTPAMYLANAPTLMLSKTYTNSMLAVLNARKLVRDRERANPSAVELPTLPTIR